MKKCNYCNEIKRLEKFRKRKKSKDGHGSICKECLKIRSLEYECSPKRRFSKYKRGAKKRNLFWNLTYEEFMIFWKRPCSKCGDQIDTIGLDRINNNIGYILSNIESCCYTCNMAKHNRTNEDFIKHCHKVSDFRRRNKTLLFILLIMFCSFLLFLL